jgi:hypothetical protein
VSKRKPDRLAGFLADLILTGVAVASLVLVDAPTWAWIGFGWAVFYALKAQAHK